MDPIIVLAKFEVHSKDATFEFFR